MHSSVATLESAQRAISRAQEQEAPKRYDLLTVADLGSLPRARWRIRSVLPTKGCGSLYGPWGSGKSFLALDMLSRICSGEPWFEHRVTPCSALCVVLEGQSGFLGRVEAWERHNERAFPDAARFLFSPFELTDDDDVVALAAAVEEAGGFDFLMIDTLNRAAPEADENSSKDMGRILKGVKRLEELTGAFVLLVAHTGKDVSKGLRGHSSLMAALDTAIEVSREGDRREWKLLKSKDGQDGGSKAFRLKVIDLGVDEDGDPVTSAVVEPEGMDHAGGIVARENERHCEQAVLAGIRSLNGIGVRCTDGRTSPDYLPTQMLSKGFNAGHPKADLGRAMDRLMGRGVLVRAVIGEYGNRNPKFGLLIKGEAA